MVYRVLFYHTIIVNCLFKVLGMGALKTLIEVKRFFGSQRLFCHVHVKPCLQGVWSPAFFKREEVSSQQGRSQCKQVLTMACCVSRMESI